MALRIAFKLLDVNGKRRRGTYKIICSGGDMQRRNAVWSMKSAFHWLQLRNLGRAPILTVTSSCIRGKSNLSMTKEQNTTVPVERNLNTTVEFPARENFCGQGFRALASIIQGKRRFLRLRRRNIWRNVQGGTKSDAIMGVKRAHWKGDPLGSTPRSFRGGSGATFGLVGIVRGAAVVQARNRGSNDWIGLA